MSEIREPFLIRESRMMTVGIRCDGCGQVHDVTEGERTIANGTVLAVERGYYSFEDGVDLRVDLCPTCTAKLLELFPALKDGKSLTHTFDDVSKIMGPFRAAPRPAILEEDTVTALAHVAYTAYWESLAASDPNRSGGMKEFHQLPKKYVRAFAKAAEAILRGNDDGQKSKEPSAASDHSFCA